MYKPNIPEKKDQKLLKKSGNQGLIKKISKLAKNPSAYGSKLMGDLAGQWVARVDPFRILYTIDEEKKEFTVTRIENRDWDYKK